MIVQHKNQTLYLPSSRTPGFLNSGTLTLQGARLQHTGDTEQGATQRPQSVTWAESSSGPAVPTGWHASSQLGDTAGPSPILSWQQLPSTQNTGTGTSTVVIMWGSCSKASRAPLPARRHQSQGQHPHQDPVQPTENHKEDGSTALVRVQLSQIRQIEK